MQSSYWTRHCCKQIVNRLFCGFAVFILSKGYIDINSYFYKVFLRLSSSKTCMHSPWQRFGMRSCVIVHIGSLSIFLNSQFVRFYPIEQLQERSASFLQQTISGNSSTILRKGIKPYIRKKFCKTFRYLQQNGTIMQMVY